jgi:hypothetical protein
MKTVKQFEAINYIETPRRCDAPVKIDQIFEARMRVFLRSRLKRSKGLK